MRTLNKTYQNKLFKREIQEVNSLWWDWYYDFNDFNDNYKYENIDYDYINKDLEKEILTEVLQGPCYRKTKCAYYAYKIIDMESFYSKEILRERKINELLGLPCGSIRTERPTLGDLITNL